MSKVISYDDFMHGRYERTGEILIVVNAEGKVIVTIDPKRLKLGGGKPYPFRDIDFTTPLVELPAGALDAAFDERHRTGSGK